MEVKLTLGELHMAAQIGTLRHIEALRKGLPDRYGFDGETGWTVHIEGAAGEIAVGKTLGIYWGGSVNTFKTEADVGKLEVRTRSKDYYELLIRDSDSSDSAYVLVTGKAPTYNVVGWIFGKDAKQPQWKKEYGGRPAAYFVPHDSLLSIDILKDKYDRLGVRKDK
jgi:hypothetical protein